MSNNSVGSVNLDLNLNTGGFNKQLKGMKGIALKVAGTIAAAFSVRAMVNFGKQCIELGSDLQEVQNVVDVTFEKMNGKVNEYAASAARTAGLSETMAKKYVGTFGAMAKAFGFNEEQAYDMSTALTTLSGDIASFYNLSQDEAYTKLKSVFTGETESLKDLGVVMTQSALDQYALANGYGKTTAAMSEQEKVALRYAFVTDQLNLASGDFIRTQDSWANQTRILSLQMESFKAAIGQGLINVLTPLLVWLNLLIEKLVVAANAFKNFTETLFGKKNNSQSSTISDATAGLGAVETSANNSTAAINETSEAAKKLKREIAGFDQITKLGSEETSSDTSASTGSTGGTDIAIASTTPTESLPSDNGLSNLAEKYKNLATSIENLKGKFKGFIDLLSGMGSWVLDNVLKPLGEWVMNEAAPAAIDALAAAVEYVTAVCGHLKPVWDWAWEYLLKPIAEFAGDALIVILERIKGAFELLTTAINVLKPVWEWIWNNFLQPAGEFVGEALTNFLDFVLDKMKALPDGINALKDAIAALPAKIEEIKTAVKEKWDDLKANITGKIVDFKAKIASKWSDLKEKWNSIKTNIKGKTAEMKAKIASKWNDLKSKWNKLLGNFKDKAVNIALNIKGKVADIKKWFNESVIDKVNNKIHKIPLLSGVSIPHLAQGGYVKKNTPQLAMIGDNRHFGEVVAPENKLQEMARMAAAGAGGTSPEVIALLKEIVVLLKTLDLDVTIDGKSLMSLIVKLINQQTKSTGVCPITV